MAACLGLASCGGAAQPARSTEAAATRPSAVVTTTRAQAPSRFIQAARLFLLPSEEAVELTQAAWDGRREYITRGMRLVESRTGELTRADDLLPTSQVSGSVKLPQHLGGGYLFFVQASGSTLFWRAATWTGELTPFANLPVTLDTLVPGLDRVYARVKRTRELVALDAKSGALLDIGPLPPSPRYGNAVFVDGWFGAVSLPFRGLLATFDAGSSWHDLGTTRATELKIEAGSISFTSEHGRQLLSRSGVITQPDAASAQRSEKTEADAGTPAARTRTLEELPLRQAALWGIPDSDQSAVLLRAGTLLRLRISDGAVLDKKTQATPEDYECQGISLGASVGFVCGRVGGVSLVYALRPGLVLEELLRYDQPRFVLASGNGTLVVRGGCERRQPHPDAYCVRFSDGRMHEMRIRGDAGVERVIALKDGRIAVLVPPRLGAAGQLTLLTENGASSQVTLQLPKAGAEVHDLLTDGFWLEGFLEVQPRVLAGWVSSGSTLIGVRITPDGKVTTGELKADAERAFFSGALALILHPGGAIEETTDGGVDWRDAATPPGVEVELPSGEQLAQGCTPVGCAFGRWLRIGWTGTGKPETLTTAEAPAPTPALPTGGTRATFSCFATGESSEPALPLPVEPRPLRPPRTRVASRPAWPAFLDSAAPDKAEGEVGFAGGGRADGALFASYIWGKPGAAWPRSARWVFRALNRFSVKNAVWSSAVGRARWQNPEQAAHFVDRNAASSSSTIFEPEPGGSGGFGLSVSTSVTEAFLVEAERAPVSLGNVVGLGFRSLSGAVKVAGQWFFGAQDSDGLRVFKVVDGKVELLREFALSREERADELALVRNTRADALGIWVRSAHWYVLPLDIETGKVGTAERYAARQWTTAKACGPLQHGWLLEAPMALQPYAELNGFQQEIEADHFAARWIAGLDAICIAELAADVDSQAPVPRLRPAQDSKTLTRRTIPLVLNDFRPQGRRWGFRCAP